MDHYIYTVQGGILPAAYMSEAAFTWFYEKLVYIEDAKIDPGHLKDYDAKAKEMQDKYTAMQKQQQQQAATEAAPSK